MSFRIAPAPSYCFKRKTRRSTSIPEYMCMRWHAENAASWSYAHLRLWTSTQPNRHAKNAWKKAQVREPDRARRAGFVCAVGVAQRSSARRSISVAVPPQAVESSGGRVSSDCAADPFPATASFSLPPPIRAITAWTNGCGWPAPKVCANRYVSPGTVIGKG